MQSFFVQIKSHLTLQLRMCVCVCVGVNLAFDTYGIKSGSNCALLIGPKGKSNCHHSNHPLYTIIMLYTFHITKKV